MLGVLLHQLTTNPLKEVVFDLVGHDDEVVEWSELLGKGFKIIVGSDLLVEDGLSGVELFLL
jgi:hypothetical protein